MELSTTQIKYLLAIHQLSAEGRSVRSLEIAKSLGVTKPSVCQMLSELEKHKLIKKQKYSDVFITEHGLAVASEYMIYSHAIGKFFEENMGLSKDEARDGAILLVGEFGSDTAQGICQRIAAGEQENINR